MQQGGRHAFLSQLSKFAGGFRHAARPASASHSFVAANYPKVLRADFPLQVSEIEAALARACRKDGDLARAAKFSDRTLATNANRPHSESTAAAYKVLCEVDKKTGDSRSALANPEKCVVADQVYQNRVSAKALACQLVRQKVLAKKLQIEGLDRKNRILTLQDELDRKNCGDQPAVHFAAAGTGLDRAAGLSNQAFAVALHVTGPSRRPCWHLQAPAIRPAGYCRRTMSSSSIARGPGRSTGR